MVATTAFITCCSLFTTATLLTQPMHHGVLVSSLTFRMSKTMIVRLDCPRGSRWSSKKSHRAGSSSLACEGFLMEESSVTYNTTYQDSTMVLVLLIGIGGGGRGNTLCREFFMGRPVHQADL